MLPSRRDSEFAKIKTELDDLSLKYWKPGVYYNLVRDLNRRKTEREEFVQQIVAEALRTYEKCAYRGESIWTCKAFFQYL